MGKKKQPAAPDPLKTAEASIQAQISALPDILEAEQEFRPQFAQLGFDISEEFAPQQQQLQLDLLEEFGPQFAEQQVAQRDILAPEVTAGQEALTDFLGGDALEIFQGSISDALSAFLDTEDEVLTDAQIENLEEQVRESQNLRGFGITTSSGALEEARQLESLRQAERQARFSAEVLGAQQIFGGETQLGQFGLAASGRTPAGITQQLQTGVQGQAPSLVQNVSPQQIFDARQQQFAAQQAAANQSSFLGTVGSNLAGSIVSSAGSNIGGRVFKPPAPAAAPPAA